MDNKKPAEKNRSSRSPRTFITWACLLAVVAAGGAHYFPEYLPVGEGPAVDTTSPVAAKPQLSSKPAIKSASQPPASAPMAPVAAGARQAEVAQIRNAAVLTRPVVQNPEPPLRKVSATTKPAQSPAKPKKRKKNKRAAKPQQIAQIAAADGSLDEGETKLEPLPPQDVMLEPAFPQVEPPSDPAPMIPVEPAPAPTPAPVETLPVAPAETAPVAPPEPDVVPRVTVPKYNDLATAVLRGDREAARELLDLGWWVEKPSASGVTPLMAAVMNGDTAMVQLLLEYGAQPTAQALALARKNKDAAIEALLEQKGAR